MWSASVITVPPSVLPLDVADVRGHCYADPDGADDTLLSAYLTAAVDQVQALTGLRLISQTVKLTRAAFDDDGWYLRLPIGPVQSVAFTYLDAAGATQTLDPAIYALTGTGSLAAAVSLIGGKSWPMLLDHPAAVTCTVQAGYGASGSTVPGSILHAIRLLVGDYYANREDTIAERGVVPATMPNGVDALLANYRIW